MKRTQEIFEKIEEYIMNTLSQEERTVFEKEMDEDIELQLEVAKHRAIHNTLGDQDVLNFKEKLIRISANIKEEKKKEETVASTFKFSSYWKIAATVIVLLGISSLIWRTTTTRNQTQNLYSAYYKPFPVNDMVRGSTDTISVIKDAIKHYSNKSYDSVVLALEKYPDLVNQQQLQLYLGNSYLNIGEEEKAATQFKEIKTNDKYHEIAQWYLSLTYLKLNSPKKTTSLLKDIIEYNGTYKNQAVQLLNSLEQ
jgi:tetratricopeptide (TPR) repeat protein